MNGVLDPLEDVARGAILVLLDVSWQSSLLIAVVLGGMWVFRVRRVSTRYLLLVCVLSGVSLLPLVSLVWTGIGVSRFSVWTEERSRTVQAMRHMVFPREVNGVGEDWGEAREWTSPPAETAGSLEAISETGERGGLSQQPWIRMLVRGVALHRYVLLFGVWVAGVSAGLLRMCWGYRALRRAKTSCRSVRDASVLAAYEKALRGMRIRKKPRLLALGQIPAPMAAGILNPVIFVPDTLGETLSSEKLRMVLIHELLHIRRYDLLVGLCQRLLGVLWFFHPLVWHLSQRISWVREDRCDGLVVKRTGAPVVYASALTDLLATASNSRASIPVAAGLHGRSRLSLRVEGILDGILVGSLPRWGISACVVATCVAVGLLSSLTVLRGPGASTISENVSPYGIDRKKTDLVRLPGGAGISGTVRDASGVPVPEVRVTLVGVRTPGGGYVRAGSRPRAETDGEGRYVLTDLRTGIYRLELHSQRLGCYGELKNVESGERDADAVLGLKSGVSGRITDLTGTPLPGARVSMPTYLRGSGERPYDEHVAFADSSGYYRLDDLPCRSLWVSPDRAEPEVVRNFYSLLIEAEGHATKRVYVRPEYGRIEDGMDFRMEAGAVSISGIVQDLYGKPVIGAEVELYPRGGRGDHRSMIVVEKEGGRFSIEGLVDDLYDLVVRAEGFAPAYVERVIGGTKDLGIVLSEGGAITGSIRVRPSDRRSGDRGLSGLLVRAHHLTKSFLWSNAWTSEDGRYRIGNLYPGAYRVSVVSERRPSIRRDLVAIEESVVEVVAGKTVSGLDFLLTPGSSVSGRIVYRSTRAPAAGIEVQLIGRGDLSGRTDEQGRYRLEGVAPGRYMVRTSVEGYVESPHTPRIEVRERKHVEDFDFELVCAGALIVRVTDEEGDPVSDAVVRSNGVLFSSRVRTDRQGVCRVGGIRPESPVSVFVNAAAYAPARADPLVLVPGEEREITIRISSGRTLEGRVTDRTGMPVQNARVVFGPDISTHMARFFGRETRTNREGYFRGEHVPEHACVIVLDDEDRFAPVRVTTSGEERCDVSVGSGGTVEGYVFDASDEPAAGARVYFEPWFCQSKTIVTDSEGRFRAERVRSGTCSVRAGSHLGDLKGEGTQVMVVEDNTTFVSIRRP